MTADELAHVACLIDKRTIELDGNVFERRTSSVDAAICLTLGFAPTTEVMASKLARVAAAYRGLEASDPDVERQAILRAGVSRAVRLPLHVRERMRELCALPFTVPAPQPKAAPPYHRSALERLEDAIDRELSKPYREQRHALLSKWRSELATLDENTHNESHAFA